MYSFLRRFRILVSLLVFLALTTCFVDFYNLTDQLFTKLLHWQFIPALLGIAGGSLGILLFLLALTLVFGRIYCSTLCPLGTYQDMVRRIAGWFKSKKARRMHYAKPYTILRYGMLTLTTVLIILGSTTLLLWLDPYSNFGRIAMNIFGPGIIAGSNLLSEWFAAIPAHGYKIFTVSAIISATVVFLTVSLMSALRGRLYCNTICPVGAFLGFLSNYSLFRLSMDPEKCNRCTLCSTKCKSQCIDVPAQQIDNSRCVQCYNCADTCNRNAIRYTFGFSKKALRAKAAKTPNTSSRRLFLASAGAIVAAGAAHTVVPALRKPAGTGKALTPPGSRSLDHLKQHCTACHACIAACPSRVLRPSTGEYGIDGLLLPVLDYNRSFCNYECTVCSTTCPNGAILPLSTEEKAIVQIGKAVFMPGRCIVVRDETDCGACDEHCPANAIEMIPYGQGLLIPKVDSTICIGCGGCEYICPARPAKAIFVEASPIHQTASLYKEKEKEDVKVDDFGF